MGNTRILCCVMFFILLGNFFSSQLCGTDHHKHAIITSWKISELGDGWRGHRPFRNTPRKGHTKYQRHPQYTEFRIDLSLSIQQYQVPGTRYTVFFEHGDGGFVRHSFDKFSRRNQLEFHNFWRLLQIKCAACRLRNTACCCQMWSPFIPSWLRKRANSVRRSQDLEDHQSNMNASCRNPAPPHLAAPLRDREALRCYVVGHRTGICSRAEAILMPPNNGLMNVTLTCNQCSAVFLFIVIPYHQIMRS